MTNKKIKNYIKNGNLHSDSRETCNNHRDFCLSCEDSDTGLKIYAHFDENGNLIKKEFINHKTGSTKIHGNIADVVPFMQRCSEEDKEFISMFDEALII